MDIEPFLDELVSKNPGTACVVERFPNSNVLRRVAVMFHYARSSIPFMYPIFGIDAGHKKDIVIEKLSTLLAKMFVTVLSTRIPGNKIVFLGS